LKLGGELLEVSSFLEQRLVEVARMIGQLLQHFNELFSG